MNWDGEEEEEEKRMNPELFRGSKQQITLLLRCRIECEKVSWSTSGFLAYIIGCLMEPLIELGNTERGAGFKEKAVGESLLLF